MKRIRYRKALKRLLTPRQVFGRTLMICALLGTVLFGLSLKTIEPLPLSESPLRFEPKRAFEYMRELAQGYPNRVTWLPNARKAEDWIKRELVTMGYAPKTMGFSEVIAGRQYTGLENVIAEKKGTRHPNEIVVAMAHYDVPDTTVEGAMDDASGVGVVLELARIFAKERSDRTILFVLTDSEEYGAFWGAKAFAESYPRANQIVAVENFDFIANGKITRILTLCDGLKSGYTPLWLRELALNSVRSMGTVEAIDFTNVVEFAERAILIPPADHGALLAAGIPAFNWVGQPDDFARVMAQDHHTPGDVVEKMRPDSFDAYGKAAERLIRSIDELPRIPSDFRSSDYWKVTSRLYVPGWVVTILHILAFIPFLTYGLTKFGAVLKRRPKWMIWRVLKNELKNAGIVLGSLLLGYVVLLMLPTLKIITQYETFPATQKSRLLYHPNFYAMVLVMACVLAVYLLFQKVFREPEDEQNGAEYAEIRHALHAAAMVFIIFLAFLKNSYLGMLLLLPPAYFWIAIRARKRAEDRVLNVLLLLGGSITFVAMSILMTTIFHVGAVYWYIFLSTAYGLFSAYTIVLSVMTLTVMIRLFRSVIL